MVKIDFEPLENKHYKAIEIAKKYMNSITDKEHDINHMYDVVDYTKKLLGLIQEEVDYDVCLVSAYFHDVGRTKIDKGHEQVSIEILRDELEKLGYSNVFIQKCIKAIENHTWNMTPTTIEGLIIKDADKLAWLGKNRWKVCLEHKQRLDKIIELLPKLRNEILYFDESKKIYDQEIVGLVKVLYDDIKL